MSQRVTHVLSLTAVGALMTHSSYLHQLPNSTVHLTDRVINTLDDYSQQMANNWTIARNALLLFQQYQKRFYDLKHSHDEFYVGHEVFLSTQRQNDYGKIRYASDRDSAKFEPSKIPWSV
jgi:hypothetical protein